MHLAAHDQRVQRMADIVHHDVARHGHDARLRVHLHLGHMAAIREGVSLDLRRLQRVEQRGRLARGHALPLRRRELEDADAAVRAGHREAAALGRELDVGHRGLEVLGGCLLALLDHARGGHQDRLALGVEAARAARAAALGQRLGIALADADLLHRDAELVGGEHGIGGLVALAGGLRADEHVDHAVLGEHHLGVLRRPAAGGFQVVGHADAAPPAALRGFRAAALEAGPVHLGQRAVQQLLEVAAVVALAHRGDVGHGALRDHVAAADLDPVDPISRAAVSIRRSTR
jgi:hypothetical protein